MSGEETQGYFNLDFFQLHSSALDSHVSFLSSSYNK